MKKFFALFIAIGCYISLYGAIDSVPVSYKGRIRPLQAYTDSLFFEFYHAKQATQEDLTYFGDTGSLPIMLHLYLDGFKRWSQVPFLWVADGPAKNILELTKDKKRFSYEELKTAFFNHPESLKVIANYYFLKQKSAARKWTELKEIAPDFLVDSQYKIVKTASQAPWNTLKAGDSIFSHYYSEALAEQLIALLKKIALFESFKGLTSLKEKEGTIRKQLQEDPYFHLLPSRNRTGEWYGLLALTLNERNFTLYSDSTYQKIRESYQNLLNSGIDQRTLEVFATTLSNAYQEIASTPLLKSTNNHMAYPSTWQLQLEAWYTTIPFISFSILGYLITLFFFIGFPSNRGARALGFLAFLIAFSIQLISLVARSWILMRPPVSNMFETVVYVPCVAVIAGIFLARRFQSRLPIVASTLLSVILLAVIEVTDLNSGLDNVQAVLNSHFWLIIHVLMIVGSYGVLILAGVFGHLYLLSLLLKLKDKELMAKCLVQTIYLGTALLIPGTILGGIWAAQSWGRFWDWDPKEAWAFISICSYLVLIHLYRFNYIQIKGLSFGSIIGLGIISFTWYGVNYILGTGMHTYGFGSGSHLYYIIFLLAESLFLIYMAHRLHKNFLCKTHPGYIKD
ncbi:hypothetical protein PHSC3_001394 [Chlamydiales bacterium STE3]|nr:hypothetical protein PHSC3_001394 [Chlamydiales bacterium STE3]